MAKRREAAVTETKTKKPKQAMKAKTSGARPRAKKKAAEEEETLERKVRPKPCRSTKRAAGNTTSTTSTPTLAVKTSKYFQSSLKKEETDIDSEDDFDMVTSEAPEAAVNAEKTEKEQEEEEDSEEDADDWEEVEELAEQMGPVELPEPVLPSQPVEIEIETQEVRKRKKRQAEFETYLKRMLNRYKKDQLINTHKVHLMCLIANGMFRNRLCSEPLLLAITLSLLPPHFSMVAKEHIDQNYLSRLLKWFRETFTLNPSLSCEECPDPCALLERRLANLSARDHQEMTHVAVPVGPEVSASLQPIGSFFAADIFQTPISQEITHLEKPHSTVRIIFFDFSSAFDTVQPFTFLSSDFYFDSATSHLQKFFDDSSIVCCITGKGVTTSADVPGKSHTSHGTSKSSPPESKVSPGTKRPAGGLKIKGDSGGKKAKRKVIKEDDEEEEKKAITSGGQRPKNSKRRSIASKVNYKEESNSEGEMEEQGLSDDMELQLTSEEDSEDSDSEAKSTKKKMGNRNSKGKVAYSKKTTASKRTDKKQVKEEECEWQDDRDDAERTTSNGTKHRSGKKKGEHGADEWLEVYLEKNSSWVCVDVEHGVGMPHLCSQNATVPVTYVVSLDGDGFIKDLGKKYDPTWMTSSRKRRVDEDWWEETLEPFLAPEDERDIMEDKELQNKLLNKPMPISVGEYKNHPLYALKRHLLKYEAIYPSSATVLGYCRGEPVYSRDCVHTLHSRDTWLKEARTVRLGEEPYKMKIRSHWIITPTDAEIQKVKGFSNRSRKARMMSELKDENDLPLFGEWQTEEYQPPIAVDGKVPRNDYGNVYLFKPCMLPVGCVHLRLPNLHRTARKLNIDAAPAVTGFDFHGGYSHAVTDGYIVCEEHEEILRAAWVEEQELQKQKEKEKREKRTISNWALLVKGLLIREKLKQRYGKKNEGLVSLAHREKGAGLSSDEEAVECGSPGAKTASETLAVSWPQNRQAEEGGGSISELKRKTMTKREKRGQEKHLFPFEKV